MEESFQIRSSEFSIGELPEVGFVRVVVVRLQVAKHRRHRVGAVVGNDYGLGVAQFREGLHVEAKIGVGVVALGGVMLALWERAFPVSKLTSCIVAALGKVVADFELVLASAEIAGRPRGKVI